jgi:segregation and condensation protein B
LEKGLIKIMGRKDLPGRPIVYGTTKAFLELFSLNTLSDLPTLKEIQPPPALEEISRGEILNTETEGTTPHQDLSMDKGEK